MTTAAPTATNGNGTAIQKKAETPLDRLKAIFATWKPIIRAVLPKHIDTDRVIRIAINIFMQKPELQKCTPFSMVRATVQCAELGLEPSPLLGEAWFIPFENKVKVKSGNQWVDQKQLEVQLMPGVIGLIKLAKQAGGILDVYAVVVDECEKEPVFDASGRLVSGFYVEQGTVRRIHHIQKIEGRTGKMFACYGVVQFADKTSHFEVFSKSQVDAIRARSKASDNGPWVTDYDAMARKTMIKQALKTVPKSPEKPLAAAIAVDNAVEMGEAFSTEALESMDAEGFDTTDQAAAQLSQSRTEALGAALGSFDAQTGEVHENVKVEAKR
jgi:recombination protein RecT